MRVLLGAVLACIFLLPSLLAVDRSKFRTCAQSGFCRRNRLAADASGARDPLWAVDAASVQLDSDALTLELTPTSAYAQRGGDEPRVRVRVTSTAAGVFRVHANEVAVDGRRQRYEAQDVLLESARAVPFAAAQRDGNVVRLDAAAADAQLLVSLQPFVIQFVVDGRTLLSSLSNCRLGDVGGD